VTEETPGFPDLSLSGILNRESDIQLIEAMEQLHPRAVMHSKAQ
jgi:hypothetical protein